MEAYTCEYRRRCGPIAEDGLGIATEAPLVLGERVGILHCKGYLGVRTHQTDYGDRGFCGDEAIGNSWRLAGEILVERLGEAVDAIAAAAAITAVAPATAIAAPAALTAGTAAIIRQGQSSAEACARRTYPSAATASSASLSAKAPDGADGAATWLPYCKGAVSDLAAGTVIPQKEGKAPTSPAAPFTAGAALPSFSAAATATARAICIPIVNLEAQYIVRYAP